MKKYILTEETKQNCMKAGQIAALEKLLERAADSLQEMTEELDGDMNNALAMEIYETLKR